MVEDIKTLMKIFFLPKSSATMKTMFGGFACPQQMTMLTSSRHCNQPNCNISGGGVQSTHWKYTIHENNENSTFNLFTSALFGKAVVLDVAF